MPFDNEKPFDYEEYKKTVRRNEDASLRKHGFNPEELDDRQRYLIFEPIEAPENYYCDGEISPKEAYNLWLYKLEKSGLNRNQISNAIKMNK